MNNNEDESTDIGYQSRTKRNKELYQKISDNELENIEVNSNASVLNVQGNDIDIDQLRQLLDKKYRDGPKRKSITIEEEVKVEPTSEPTKEYDLGSFIEKAKETKETNYEEERLKKIHDTQFNILQSINVEKEEDSEKSSDNTAEQELMSLINTIALKEQDKNKYFEKSNEKENIDSSTDLDLFADLKGDENTDVIPPMSDEEIEKTMENTFYTGKMQIENKDYDDFDDLKKEINSNSIVIKILLVIFFIIVIFGIVFFLDKIFTWGIF